MKTKLLCFLALLGTGTAFAQEAPSTFTASVFNNAVALPGGSFTAPFHPGVDLGWVIPVRTGSRWDHLLTPRLGFYHQRIVHSGVQLYAEYTFRFHIVEGLSVDGGPGLGYLHTFEQHDIFKLQSDGTYERTGRLGKPHAMASAMLGFNLAPADWPVRPFIQYRFRVMSPFVRSYVPFLPSTSLHLGATFDLNL